MDDRTSWFRTHEEDDVQRDATFCLNKWLLNAEFFIFSSNGRFQTMEIVKTTFLDISFLVGIRDVMADCGKECYLG